MATRPVPTCVSVEDLPPIPRAPAGLFGPRAQIVLGACACAGAALFVYAVDPSQHAVYPQCLLYNMTGIYCAGCGATRALHALLHGRVLAALHDNALFVAALPLLIYVVAVYVLDAWRRNAWPAVYVDPRQVLWRGAAAFAVMVLFMVLRNLPGAAFAWLRPLG